jgi:ribosome-associated toxin RatA of RatAB toxin-antitoxin module
MRAERASRRTTINAPAADIWSVILDFERYPEWVHDLKKATVVSLDDEGRAVEVAFEASAIGRTTRYTLHYDYSGGPDKLAWKLVHGDIMRSHEGSYTLEPSATEPGVTDVIYELTFELSVPMPGFVKRRAEVRILRTLAQLKARVEQ